VSRSFRRWPHLAVETPERPLWATVARRGAIPGRPAARGLDSPAPGANMSTPGGTRSEESMDWPPFYRTAMGRDFFDSTLPKLVHQLERIADRLPAPQLERPAKTDALLRATHGLVTFNAQRDRVFAFNARRRRC
jgi:hypothetical protein